jgi:hypothetical protein
MFFGGGVVIKLGDEVIGSIGAAGAPGAKLDDNCAHAALDKIRDRLKWRSGSLYTESAKSFARKAWLQEFARRKMSDVRALDGVPVQCFASRMVDCRRCRVFDRCQKYLPEIPRD